MQLREYGRKLTKKKNKVVVDTGVAAFVSNAKVIIPKKKLLICRDTKDNMLLECCSMAKADFLITGDKDLLDIEISKLPKELAKLRIVTPRRFLEL